MAPWHGQGALGSAEPCPAAGLERFWAAGPAPPPTQPGGDTAGPRSGKAKNPQAPALAAGQCWAEGREEHQPTAGIVT